MTKSRIIKAILVFHLCVAAIFASCAIARADFTATQSTATIEVNTDAYSARFDLESGLWNAWWGDGAPMIANAFALWQVERGDTKKTVASAGKKIRTVELNNFFDRIGEGREASFAFDDAELNLHFELKFRFYKDKPFFVIFQTVSNNGKTPARISATVPLETDVKRSGGFFAGPDPLNVWALENGYKFMFDFFVRCVSGAEAVNSNWNAAFFDRTTHRTSLIGFLTADKGLTNVRAFYDPDNAMKAGAWTGFSTVKAVASYEPAAAIAPGERFEGERLYIGVSTEPQPHPTLERFADAMAEHYNIKIWNRPIPTGWNSWATRYHHGITEDNMLDNARRAAENLVPFGMTTFQIDDGWQIAHGDWEPNEKFPHGMKWIADEIAKLGFQPGLWLEPFCVSADSKLAREHPDWIVRKNEMAETLMPKDWLILDLTHPEVKKWLGDLFRKVGREWGFRFIKIDFIYYALLGKNYHDPDVTAVEAYRDGIRIIREALPEDAFLMAVGAPIANSVGLADGMRLGLDITPNWGDDEGYAAQGVKPMARNLARRYYLNHRVWINHPDMFYLGSPEETERWGRQIPLEEARTYATLASLVGGIVKIGDSFIGLNDEQTGLLRRLLPVYPDTARPIDLFEHLYPEVWHLPIRNQDLQYDVLAFFNWGRNRSWGALEEEREKDIQVYFSEIGLSPNSKYLVSEFWSGEFKGEAREFFKDTLPPRTVRVYAIHEAQNRPQFIGSNRHVTQGATDIEWVRWDPLTNTLSGCQKTDPNFKYRIMIYAPDEFRFVRAAIGGLQAEITTEGNIVTLTFEYSSRGARTWQLYFEEK